MLVEVARRDDAAERVPEWTVDGDDHVADDFAGDARVRSELAYRDGLHGAEIGDEFAGLGLLGGAETVGRGAGFLGFAGRGELRFVPLVGAGLPAGGRQDPLG